MIHLTQAEYDKMATYRVIAEELLAALSLTLDQVDYTAGACGAMEMVGACLDSKVLDQVNLVKAMAQETLREGKE